MSNSTPKKNSFFGGAAILTAGIIIVKLIGALYKIPLGNILTDAAFADFNTAYYIYSLLIVISTGGLPVALSKMVSEANALNRPGQVKKIFRLSLVVFCVLGALCCGVMLFFPRWLAGLMNNSQCYPSILALAPALFFICPLSALRGYFQGHSNMVPTSVSQIIEALCKLVVGLALASFLKANGSEESMVAAGAIVGVSVGCALAMVYVLLCYLRRKRSSDRCDDTPDSSGKILKTLAMLAIPITLGSSVIALTNILDTSIVFGRLQDAVGLKEDAARALKGIYDKALTLYNLPSAFMVPLTASVIPSVSAALAVKNHRLASQISETTLRTTALIAFPAGVGLTVLSRPIMQLLYPATDVALAGEMLAVLGMASIGVCFMLVCNSILQAHRMVFVPMITTVIGCGLKIFFTWLLVGDPDIGIRGGSYSTLVCFGIIAILDLIIVKLALRKSLSLIRAFLKPGIAAAVMGLAAWAVYGLASKVLLKIPAFRAAELNGGAVALTNMGNALSVVCAIGVAFIIYVVLILVTKTLSKEDLSLMPKGDKIARLLRIR